VFFLIQKDKQVILKDIEMFRVQKTLRTSQTSPTQCITNLLISDIRVQILILTIADQHAVCLDIVCLVLLKHILIPYSAFHILHPFNSTQSLNQKTTLLTINKHLLEVY